MRKYKNIGLVVVIFVIGFNIYDYFKVTSNSLNIGIEKCSKKFRTTNPEISKKIADKYCECAIKNIGAKKILENEKLTLQNCFEKAKR